MIRYAGSIDSKSILLMLLFRHLLPPLDCHFTNVESLSLLLFNPADGILVVAGVSGNGVSDGVEVNDLGCDPLDIGGGTINEALGLEAGNIGAGILFLNLDLFAESRGVGPSGSVKLSFAKNFKAAEGRRISLSNRMSEVSKALFAGDYLTAELAIQSLMSKIDNSKSGEPDWIKPSEDKDSLYQSLVELLQLIEYFANE